MSRFIFLDEITGEYHVEYIEPLVSHLRFPLARCIQAGNNDKDGLVNFKGWILPPPPHAAQQHSSKKAYYFDVGATSWGYGNDEDHGKSLKFMVHMWERHGIRFDSIYAYEQTATTESFLKQLPPDHSSRDQSLHFQQCSVAGSLADATEDHPFVPDVIANTVSHNDYVVLKVDLDQETEIEDGIMSYVLNHVSFKVDEVLWEHHVSGNYLLGEEWNGRNMSLKDSYNYFLKLRRQGIRAHSWV